MGTRVARYSFLALVGTLCWFQCGVAKFCSPLSAVALICCIVTAMMLLIFSRWLNFCVNKHKNYNTTTPWQTRMKIAMVIQLCRLHFLKLTKCFFRKLWRYYCHCWVLCTKKMDTTVFSGSHPILPHAPFSFHVRVLFLVSCSKDTL